jgi:hypothetical protein
VGGDLAGRQPLRGQRDHQFINPREPALPFLDDPRLERRLPVARHVDLDLADLGQDRLRAAAVTRVAAVATFRRVPGVAEVVLHLHLERRLQHRLRQIAQQAAGADQLDPLAPRTINQLTSKRLLAGGILRDRRHLLRHYELPSASPTAGKSGPRSYTVNRTVPRDRLGGLIHEH